MIHEELVTASETTRWRQVIWQCPSCERPSIALVETELHYVDFGHGRTLLEKPNSAVARIIWPRRTRTAASEAPEGLRGLYEEAALILDDSPRSAAALARRALQEVLVDHLGAEGRTLEAQIDSVIDELPAAIAQALHGLRTIGNFAAHPIKSQTTGEVVDVEPGEAEWTLDILEALFLHVFVAPARLRGRLDALNEKLEDAGKPRIDPETGMVLRD